ncbi:hypothetical protein [Paraburkholderia sp. C35]|uniref:hypothetical protein n=1 Tax=Paraburkholderia sp. C35 TaxID=2126993 RepID=UPI000D685BA0|nr:hypothetical protein [Paraburkholderia sp. C35]
MRKALIALAALLAAGVAHAEPVPFFVHGIALGQSLPPLCTDTTSVPCVAGRVGPVGNLDAYMLAHLAPAGSGSETSAIVGVDKAGKVRVVLSSIGPASDALDRARDGVVDLYGPPTVEGDRFSDWNAKDSVLGVTHRSTFTNVAYAFDDAFAPAALDLMNLMFPKE